MKKFFSLIINLLCLIMQLTGQMRSPYILNGAAWQRSCNCYMLTPDVHDTSGTVWNKNKINLNQSFNYVFDVNLGCKDTLGADGIGFILQTRGTNLGANGSGIGFTGISPSLGILIDTYENVEENDPPFDHVAIQMNGLSDHKSKGNLTGPVQAVKDSNNIEDCRWHLFRISWDATLKHMEVSIDGDIRLKLDKDLVNDIFGGDPKVYWGFAGSTGGLSNTQQFCAALRPDFNIKEQQIFCDGTPIEFKNNSSSFGAITSTWWDFGDGTYSKTYTPTPHLYNAVGRYEAKLVISDNSGCISDTLKKTFIVGSYPEVNFAPNLMCLGDTVRMKDLTTVKAGSLKLWDWDWGDGTTAKGPEPIIPFTKPGIHRVQLKVTSKEGCISSAEKSMTVRNKPVVSGIAQNVCLGKPISFHGSNLTPSIPIQKWHWQMGNGDTLSNQHVTYTYANGGNYVAKLEGISTDGCKSLAADVPLEVITVVANAGNDTTVAVGQPLQLRARLNDPEPDYTWIPATGLNDPYIPFPVAILKKDQTYRLIVTSPGGCRDEDTINVKVYKGPEFYVPNAFTPNGDGQNDNFRVIAAGISKLNFFRIFNKWGQLVYQSTNLSGKWDGTYNGHPVAADTYVWITQGIDYKGNLSNAKGTVTLIR